MGPDRFAVRRTSGASYTAPPSGTGVSPKLGCRVLGRHQGVLAYALARTTEWTVVFATSTRLEIAKSWIGLESASFDPFVVLRNFVFSRVWLTPLSMFIEATASAHVWTTASVPALNRVLLVIEKPCWPSRDLAH